MIATATRRQPRHGTATPALRSAAVAASLALVAALLVLVGAPPAGAVTLTATTEAQLRNALASPDTDVVVLGADVSLDSCQPLQRTVSFAIRLDGAGHTIHQSCAPSVLVAQGVDLVHLRDLHVVGAPHEERVPTIRAGDLQLDRVVITGGSGNAVDSSGQIRAAGLVVSGSGGSALRTTKGAVAQGSTVTCAGCRLVDNRTDGIEAWNPGSSVTVGGSEISRNGVSGISSHGGPWVVASTLDGNGLAGVTSAGYVRVLSSTISRSGGYGIRSLSEGGAGQDGTIAVVLSTLVDNGWYNLWSTNRVGVYVSVVVGAEGDNCSSAQASGTASFADDTTCGLDGHSQQGPGLDPRLGRLAYNGGPTPTMRPLRDSPLIAGAAWPQCANWVENWYADADQRGWSRPAVPGGPCDIGAVQLGGTPPESCPERFVDVASDHPFCWEIDWMAGNGLGSGWPDGTFRPGTDISRQALAAFLWRLAGSPEVGAGPGFVDVPASHEFAQPIAWMAESGTSEGYDDGTFRPGAPITRQALAAMLWRLAERPAPPAGSPAFHDVAPGHPFATPIAWLAAVEVTTGYDDGGFHPGARTSRQAMAAFLQRFAGVHQVVEG